MPARTSNPQPKAEPVYPNLERFIESADRDAAANVFAATKEKLGGLASGAKAPAAKKALSAVERAEALIGQLYGVREKLEEQARAKKGRR